ncbi:unnamed protein product [Coffea canephora]|uniref:Uncharacterized protein n=1 Tax=Coffea canephora TaxID=49390 RepID=A0A068UL28_COFCA|nr:unnamed protein product [Coffea canephora]
MGAGLTKTAKAVPGSHPSPGQSPQPASSLSFSCLPTVFFGTCWSLAAFSSNFLTCFSSSFSSMLTYFHLNHIRLLGLRRG